MSVGLLFPSAHPSITYIPLRLPTKRRVHQARKTELDIAPPGSGKPHQDSPAGAAVGLSHRQHHLRRLAAETPADRFNKSNQQYVAGEMRGNTNNGVLKRDDGLRPNRMGEALAARRWGSHLTFSWAGSFLWLGSTVTIKEEHLEATYKNHERWVRLGCCLDLRSYGDGGRRRLSVCRKV